MRLIIAIAALLVATASAPAQPGPQAPQNQPPQNVETIKFAINRNGDQIGTHTLEFRRNGPETLISLATHVEVKVAFFTAYRLEHTGSERWVNGRLVSLKTTTDDNGTPHKVEVAAKGPNLVVEADGKSTQVDGNLIPASALWNTSLVRQSVTLDTQKGNIMKISVADVGLESVVVQGKPIKAHRYTIKGAFNQDVWYDERGNLVQAQVMGPDGSAITYQLF